MPDRETLWHWRLKDADFSAAFARAREANAETIEDRIADIEDKVLAEEVNPQAANVVLSSMRWRARVLQAEAVRRQGRRSSTAGTSASTSRSSG
jgi:hypothetical protein